MGKPLSRPDCLRQNPRCLGKGDDEEAYIEDCYVPQRSIYDTMRINEQIDQGTKLSQPSRSTLGSGGGGGEGSTLSSNGTLGTDLGSVFVARVHEAGVPKKLDERVIFDALKLTGDPQTMLPVGAISSGLPIVPSTSATGGAAVVKRRHQGGDRKDNPNRRSWKAFMPPSYPDFAERFELSPIDNAEKRLSGAGIPVSPLHSLPSLLPPPPPATSTSPLPPYSPSPVSSDSTHTPPVSNSPCLTPTMSPLPSHLHPVRQRQPPHLQKHKMKSALPSPSKEQPPPLQGLPNIIQTKRGSVSSPQHSPSGFREPEGKNVKPLQSVKSAVETPDNWEVAAAKASDSERDSPILEQDQDTAPLIAPLVSPKPVFCPPTKARTWPRSMRSDKRGVFANLPVLPPLPPLLGEESDLDEESLYLLDPPSPFLQGGEVHSYEGLPLSPCISQEGGEEGLLAWAPPAGELRERTASELCFEEDERRILQELDAESEEEEERRQKAQLEEEVRRTIEEEKDWEAVLKMENKSAAGPTWDRSADESLQDWEAQQLSFSGHWPLLTPPVGFGGPVRPSTSPCPSSEAGSDELFLELERQCQEEEEWRSLRNKKTMD
ncbi:WAS/WASL-interacting protein family member 1-like [Denticeps clupeoides]|uniref:WAS/WASL-interacting protein family member 1-like n=1 Tax=Denticeps clupeoides TaxID=299321 RepID=UPI0010A3254E|nr:uncharacterized protein KIAA0754 homolog [Denticeps clupeoides]